VFKDSVDSLPRAVLFHYTVAEDLHDGTPHTTRTKEDYQFPDESSNHG